MRKQFIVFATLVLFFSTLSIISYPPAMWVFGFLIPLVLLGLYDMLQTKHTLWHNYPVFGHMRWLMEDIRPMIQQYFVESDIDGAPINRIFRSVVVNQHGKFSSFRKVFPAM